MCCRRSRNNISAYFTLSIYPTLALLHFTSCATFCSLLSMLINLCLHRRKTHAVDETKIDRLYCIYTDTYIYIYIYTWLPSGIGSQILQFGISPFPFWSRMVLWLFLFGRRWSWVVLGGLGELPLFPFALVYKIHNPGSN